MATDISTAVRSGCARAGSDRAIRASIAMPGIFSPVEIDGDWLVDGGLVNPVPVSVCRALGADLIIAVNLNEDLLGRRLVPEVVATPAPAPAAKPTNWLDMVKTVPAALKTQMAGFRLFGQAERHLAISTCWPIPSTSCRTTSPARGWRANRRMC